MKLLSGLLLTALLLAALPARATNFLFIGAEDIDFSGASSNVSSWCSSNGLHSGYSRCSISTADSSSSTTAIPPTQFLQTPAFAATATVWLHFRRFSVAGTLPTTANDNWIAAYGNDGVVRLLVRGTGTSGQLKLSTRNGAGTITDLATCSGSLVGDANYYDLAINYSGSGSITLYQGGTAICSYSGNVVTDSATGIDQFYMAAATTACCGNEYYSEVIVADGDTRSMALVTLNPSAAGTTQQWTSATAGNISKTTISDTTYNSTSTNSQISDWTVPSLPAGSWNLLAVKQIGRAEIGATGPQHFAFTCRPNGQADTTSTTQNPVTSFGNYSVIWPTNCATAGTWSPSDLTSANFGMESLP